VFQNRVLRISGPKKDEMTEGWRKLHNDELHNLYSSSSIIRMIKSRRMRWAVDVTRVGKKRNAYRILVGKPEGDHWEDQNVGGWTILKLIDIKIEIGWDGMDWIALIWLRRGTSGRLL
jgi:hypothetical protein